jgi:hypothetical protein
MTERHRDGLNVSIASLAELSAEESGHIAMLLQNQSGPVNEQAFRDCVNTIRAEHSKASVNSADDLMAMRKKMQERKGYKV